MKENIMLFEILNNVASSTAFPFQKIYGHIFKSSSSLCQTFYKALNIIKVDYLHFMCIYVLFCKNQQIVVLIHILVETNFDIFMTALKYTN